MSYYQILNKMKLNPTDGSEYGLKNTIGVTIGHTHCEYCRKEILGVWDKHNAGYWYPFLGNQARKQNVYKYSEIIQAMRKFYHVEGEIWNNNLLNVHARIHTFPKKDYSIIAKPESIRILCNDCFQKTYKRVKIQPENKPNMIYEITVLEENGETIESVMKELGVTGTIIK